jgi:hypothetical protein
MADVAVCSPTEDDVQVETFMAGIRGSKSLNFLAVTVNSI